MMAEATLSGSAPCTAQLLRPGAHLPHCPLLDAVSVGCGVGTWSLAGCRLGEGLCRLRGVM